MKHWRHLVLAVAMGLAGTACAGGGDSAHDREVAAAFYPLAWVAGEVAGPDYTVVNLTSPGGEPHDLELTIRETAHVARADLVVYQHGFQPSVDDAVTQVAEGAVLDVEEAVALRPEAGAEHAEEPAGTDQHDHGDIDPHFWQDPLLMADLGDAIAGRLAGLDPAAAGTFSTNASTLRRRLTTLDREFVEGLAACPRHTVVVTHEAFGYLTRYGLHFEGIAGLSPEAEPTPADLSRLQALIRSEGITTVFTERLSSPKMAQMLAADLGIRTDVLDPIEGLSDQTSGEDYLSLMRANLAALKRANGC